jgi:hypothetical protein
MEFTKLLRFTDSDGRMERVPYRSCAPGAVESNSRRIQGPETVRNVSGIREVSARYPRWRAPTPKPRGIRGGQIAELRSLGVRRAIAWIGVVLILGTAVPFGSAITDASASAAPPLHPLVASSTLVYSSNWAGYAALGSKGSVSKASAAWTEPGVKCPSTGSRWAVFWVGIDGYTSGSVEQIGTLTECSSGKLIQYAWWEIYPLNSIQKISGVTVHSGDSVSASVTHSDSAGTFTLALHDGTQSFSKTIAYVAERNSAECITERPTVNGKLPALADFGTVTFSSCTATIGGKSAGIGAFSSVKEIVMVNDAGTMVLARPSALTSNTKFSVTWEASGP